jgi:hypothetical protein
MPSATSENNDKVALLLGKPKTRDTFTLYVGSGEERQEIEMTVEALSMKDYDKLLSKFPPSEEEKARGLTYELEKFAPALIAACLVDPELTPAQARQLWSSENWSRGDVEGLFSKVLTVNHRESTVPFNARG